MSLFYNKFPAAWAVGSIIFRMSVTLHLTPSTVDGPRSLNILRDLPAVADLVELCFDSTLDADGRMQVDQMRRNGRDSTFLNWAPRMVDTVSLPLSGFVWEEKGKIIGNVSLIPFHKNGHRLYMIANVATHPKHRRRGIGRALTQMAVDRIRERGADSIWLHVRDDNPGAISLYRQLGFVERARRTSWRASEPHAFFEREMPHSLFEIAPRRAPHWEWQKKWLERAYPPALTWYTEQRSWNSFAPGLFHSLFNLLTDADLTHWSIFEGNNLLGLVTHQGNHDFRSDRLWLAFPSRPHPDAVTELLLHARKKLGFSRNLAIEYPVGPMDDSIHAAGFRVARTLLWMEAPGRG